MSRRESMVWLALLAIGFLLGFIGGYNVAVHQQKNTVVVRDTITKVVTVYKDFPKPVKTASVGFVPIPAYRFLTDTVTQEIATVMHDTDTIYLPRESKYYEEEGGSLRMWVSGVDPRLDRYELDTRETVVTNTITKSAPRWSIGLQAGYGIAFYDKRCIASPFMGIGVTYRLFPP